MFTVFEVVRRRVLLFKVFTIDGATRFPIGSEVVNECSHSNPCVVTTGQKS